MSKELFVRAEEVSKELGISKPFALLSQKVTKAAAGAAKGVLI